MASTSASGSTEMRMRLSQRVRRRVRRVIARAGAAEVAADKPVRIDDLVSPLRYDILVRQRYLSLITESPELLEGDLGALLELSRSHEYHTWFVAVVVPRFMPHLIGRDDEIAAHFERRVRATVELVRSVQESGLDPKRPITLRTGRRIEPTATGKRLARRLYPGTAVTGSRSCGRAGSPAPAGWLPGRQHSFTPLDNTALLLPAPIDPTTYRRFLALSYGPLVEAALARGQVARPPSPRGSTRCGGWPRSTRPCSKGPDSASPGGL